jgi:hypothetical protein
MLGGAACARAEICLPPVFEGGKRLAAVGESRVFWLDLLLRQHEVCWRAPATPDERRVFVFGNSGIFGLPVAARDTSVEVMNRSFVRDAIPARVYNLGYVFAYQIKDALIVREALRYRPDVIVYASTLSDQAHVSLVQFPPLIKFFNANSRAVDRFADEKPRGLAEPLANYQTMQKDVIRPRAAWQSLRDSGLMLRVAASHWARDIRQSWFPGASWAKPKVRRPAPYKCGEVKQEFQKYFSDWQSWSTLAYLEQVREETGAEIIVVNWPVARDQRGDCYNARYTTSALAEYSRWLRSETERRRLHYVDLQDVLPASEFVDSAHLNAAGHRRVAGILGGKLRDVLQRAEEQTR